MSLTRTNDIPDVDTSALTEEIDHLKAELSSVQDQLLRQMADFQNFRRRVAQERFTLISQGRTQFAEKMVDVLDDLHRSLEVAEQVPDETFNEEEAAKNAYEALHKGIVLVYDKFVQVLAKLGVEAIDVIGQPFDEELHEALMQQPAPDGIESGSVLNEIQRGYRIDGRVLRHARVVVAQ